MPPADTSRDLLSTAIRDLGLSLSDSPLAAAIERFQKELEAVGVHLQPHFYLSTDWGVPFGTISIGIPFYLARPDLMAVHAEKVGHLEGAGQVELLRYLRHEMGHVVNYAWRLYEQAEWIQHFGAMTQPYVEEYRPAPFSRRYVQHLPGWYAQKHPDEDWAETFAVWMTPNSNWRRQYADWPEALAKLNWCDAVMSRLRDQPPLVTVTEADEDVSQLTDTLEDFYRRPAGPGDDTLPPGLDGALLAIFQSFGEAPLDGDRDAWRPAEELILRLEIELCANVYRWTGHFPEATRRLVRFLAERAQALGQSYPRDHETQVTIGLTALVTSLAMNHVIRGSYLL